jgi:N-acetylglutamate synthase-like GNAT family acetyltransferase
VQTIRRAKAGDSQAIRALIRRVRINPIGLVWQRFVVAIDEQDRVIGCGQIKPHGDGTRELASIAVVPERQSQGIGTLIIQHLLKNEPLPLFLTCRSTVGPYYQKFGFKQVRPELLPPYFRRIWRVANLLSHLFPGTSKMWVMVKPQPGHLLYQ